MTTRTTLLSREVRRRIAGTSGVRIIDFENDATNATGKKTGLLQTFLGWLQQNTIGRFVGWIGGGIVNLGRGLIEGFIQWTWGLGVEVFINIAESLYSFDWNATDEELAKQIESVKISMVSTWSSWISRGIVKIGTIVVSSKVFLPVPVVSKPALSAYIRANSLPEAISETVAEFRQAMTQTIINSTKIGYIKSFAWARIGLKGLGNWLEKNANWDPGANAIMQKWGAKDGPELSLEQVINDKVDQIKTPWLKAAAESALEGAWEGFTEGLLMVAEDIDAFIAKEKEEENPILGEIKALEVQPDKDNPNEKLLFFGYQNTVMGDVMSTLNTYQLIHNRDIGYFQDEYQQEILKNKQLIKRGLTLIWRTRKAPPWTVKIEGLPPYKRVEFTVPHAKQNLSWAAIKAAMGGADGISIGPWRATAVTDRGIRPYIFGANQQDAIDNLERALSLSEVKILSVSTSVLAKTRKRRREPIRFYPVFSHIYQAFPTTGREGKEFADGSRARIERRRVEMWRANAPPDAEPIFRAVT